MQVTPKEASTAAKVNDLYRDYPYPGHGVVSGLVASMLEEPVAELRARTAGRKLRLLDAGCGTGEQAVGIAKRYPDIDVVGADFSENSLKMAVSLAKRHGAAVNFVRQDLMQPVQHGSFDAIVSVGVLHSLAEPRQGFVNLRRAIADDGVFVGMVYGTFGKWELIQVRDALEMLGASLSRADRLEILRATKLAPNAGLLHYLLTLSRRRRFGPRTSFVEAVKRVVIGRSAAYQADAFTHVQELTYSCAELAELLESTGWSFEGWPRKSGLPDTPEQLFEGTALELMKQRSVVDQASVYERLIRPLCFYFVAKPSVAGAG